MVPRHPCQTFGDRLRQFRRDRGWRQVDLARVIGVNKDTVRKWETGRATPRLGVLGRKARHIIALLLEVAKAAGG